jgi:hypothetical protein
VLHEWSLYYVLYHICHTVVSVLEEWFLYSVLYHICHKLFLFYRNGSCILCNIIFAIELFLWHCVVCPSIYWVGIFKLFLQVYTIYVYNYTVTNSNRKLKDKQIRYCTAYRNHSSRTETTLWQTWYSTEYRKHSQ